MAFMQEVTIPFPHLTCEWWLGDSGYVGANHCLLPFKKNEEEGRLELGRAVLEDGSHIALASPDETSLPVTAMEYWNKVHAKFRSRVERKFSHFATRWRWTEYCRFDEKRAELAMAITVAIEAWCGFAEGSPYRDFQPAQSDLWKGPLQRCLCVKGDVDLLRRTKEQRMKQCQEFFYTLQYVPTSMPAGHAKSGSSPREFMMKELAARQRDRELDLDGSDFIGDQSSDDQN